MSVADPENVIFLQDMMRDVYREIPPVEEMEKMVKEVEKTIDYFKDQQTNIVDLGEKVDKARKEIANSTAKLNYQQRVTWAYTFGSLLAAWFSYVLMKQGFRDWSTAEKVKAVEIRRSSKRKS